VKRRAFIAGLAGAAAMPLAARAQERVRRIGVLMGVSADDPEGHARVEAFRQGLHQLGWTDGLNIRIDTRYSDHRALFRAWEQSDPHLFPLATIAKPSVRNAHHSVAR
jgi:DNA-binding LacI/PurR family transcriptional regulator